jgi:hypothetical protein
MVATPPRPLQFDDEQELCLLAIAAATLSAAAATAAATAAAIASVATATTTATAATPIAAATAAAAGRTLFAGTSFVDSERTALEVLGMEHLNGLFRVLLGAHLNEGEPSRPTGHAVLHDVYGNHHARLREIILQVILRRGEGKITDE